MTIYEAVRAFAALDGRLEVKSEDLHIIAPMALRMRRSSFIEKFLSEQSMEEEEINKIVDSTLLKT